MVYRVLTGICMSLIGWMFMIWSGAFGGSSFDTNFFGDGELVERPVAEVYAALDAVRMDSPSTDLAVLESTPRIGKLAVPQQSISWTVYSGEHPAITMSATLEAAKDGAATVVHTETTRHKLPATQITAPAFNVPGGMELVMRMTMASALAPMDSEYATELSRSRASLQNQMLNPVNMIRAADAQFAPHMGKGSPSKDEWIKENEERYRAVRNAAANRSTGVSFAPGQPMVDPTLR